MRRKVRTSCVVMLIGAVFYCEFLIDYIKLYECNWPSLVKNGDAKELHALILADTHLLGPLRGHWLDKFYREWHMHRAFQTALTLFQPEVVFVLGDLFDEGDLVDEKQFKIYVERYKRIFRPPASMHIISAVGNHDVGFHYKLHPYFTERFKSAFNNTAVQLYTFKGVHFVFINSMAMENDGCGFCEEAQHKLQQIGSSLECLKDPMCDKNHGELKRWNYSRPVLMQHFPTYRVSDRSCHEHDSPFITRYREGWEVLSKESTDLLGQVLHPRVAFAGHSHHYCHFTNRFGVDEYTVASFSWRNKINPSVLLASFTPEKHAIIKCDTAAQVTNYTVYICTLILITLLMFLNCYKRYIGVLCKLKKNK